MFSGERYNDDLTVPNCPKPITRTKQRIVKSKYPQPNTGHCTYKGEGGTRAVISPNKLNFKHGEELIVACVDDKTSEHICTNGQFDPSITKCPDEEKPISSSTLLELSTVVAVVSGLITITLI